ncbi:MAG: O-antigen ligase family protein [Flavobacteriales bacterium]|jgi:O-antigen ligase
MELPTPKRDQRLQQLLIVLAFAIPWAKKAIPTLIGIVIVFALIRFFKRKSISLPPGPAPLLALLSLFLLLVLGTAYTQHPDSAWNEIGIKLSFLLFPLLSLFTPTLQRDDVRKLHQSFVAGCFVFIGITVTHALWVVAQHPDWYYFTYDRLSWYIHPTYAATYQALALFTLLQAGIKRHFLAGNMWLHLLSITLILVFIALLSSKAGFLCALLVLGYAMLIAYRSGIHLARIAMATTLSIALFIATILALPTTSDRVKDAVADIRTSETAVESTDTVSTAHTSSTSMRFITWSASWNLLRDNPFGTGTGDTQPELNQLYRQQGEDYAALRQFNAHNQFLQTGAEIGWIGLVALMVVLIALWSIGRNEPTVRIFVLLCVLNFLFESFLEVQAGIVFCSFWTMVYSRVKE